MQTKEYRTIDKSAWPRGEWDDEPDKKQWQDKETGFACLIVRNSSSGALCGYVGVPEGHRFFEKGYDDVDVDVHGGLTFANHCAKTDDETRYVCHVPEAGDPDNIWWLGFDCNHAWDLAPGYEHRHSYGDEHYRDIEYVEHQIAKLASQLA